MKMRSFVKEYALTTCLLLVASASSASAFLPSSHNKSTNPAFRRPYPQSQTRIAEPTNSFRVTAADGDGDGDDAGDSEASRMLMRSLQNRVQQQRTTLQNLRRAQCRTHQIDVPEPARLVSVDYPVAACGSDDVHVVHLESGAVLARACTGILHDDAAAKESRISPERVERVRQQSNHNSNNDNNQPASALLAVALQGSYLCEARATGGLHVHRLSRDETTATAAEQQQQPLTLVSQGRIPALNDVLVTAMQIQDNILWVATDQGTVEAYRLDKEWPLALRQQPDRRWRLNHHGGDVLPLATSLSVHADLGLTLVTADDGRVHFLSTDDNDDGSATDNDAVPMESLLPPFVRPGVVPTCATVVAHKMDPNNDDPQYSLVCGANDGSLSVHALHVDDDGTGLIDRTEPLLSTASSTATLESHLGPVQCLTSPAPGLLLSGALDGTLRLTDVREQLFLYHITGYHSSTLGTVWTDGTRIVTNGARQQLTVYDFAARASSADSTTNSETKDPNNNSKKRGSDDWNEEGGSVV